MSAGIAPQMVKHFGCDNFDMELNETISLKKLGNIDFQHTVVGNEPKNLYVVNAYTQFYPGQNSPGCNQPLDYEALTLCLRKMNLVFKGMHIGLPQMVCYRTHYIPFWYFYLYLEYWYIYNSINTK